MRPQNPEEGGREGGREEIDKHKKKAHMIVHSSCNTQEKRDLVVIASFSYVGANLG